MKKIYKGEVSKNEINLLNKELLKRPKEKAILELKGFCLKKMGKQTEALNIYKYAYGLDKKDDNIAGEIGEILIKLKHFNESITYLEKATKNKSSYYLYLLAIAYFENEEIEKALNITEMLEELNLETDDKENLKELKEYIIKNKKTAK